MSEISKGATRPARPSISDADKAAISSEGVKTAVAKLTTDLKSNASKDTIAKDKADAFAKYQAAGGQASSLQAFGEEVSHTSDGDRKALREAFGITADEGHHGKGTSGRAGVSQKIIGRDED